MLNHKYRANRIDIEKTIRTGIPIFGKLLYAKISKIEAEKLSIAIIISKKIEKTSVGRHLIKRKISSYIEEGLQKINPKFKKTIVIFIKNTKLPLNYIEAREDVNFILKKAAF